MATERSEALRDSLSLELRRGTLVIAVLAALRNEEYGYSLKTQLADKGVDIDEGTLYPLLRRLETQGLLGSRWVMTDARPRRYYKLNAVGARLLKELSAEWREISAGLDRLLR
jgi:PadR family transcriptional regulator PadR